MSFPEIGRRLGGLDHSSAIHGYKQAQKLRYSDPEFGMMLNAVLSVMPFKTPPAPFTRYPAFPGGEDMPLQ